MICFLQFEFRATDFVKGKQAHFSLLKTQVLNICERSQLNLTLRHVLEKPRLTVMFTSSLLFLQLPLHSKIIS